MCPSTFVLHSQRNGMMIYNTEQQATQTGNFTEKKPRQLGTAARRALDGLLSSLYRLITREWLDRILPKMNGGCGLHLASGNGEDTFMIDSLLKGQVALLGIDEDAALIQAARHSASRKRLEQVRFARGDLFSLETTQACDFIYARIWEGALNKPGEWLQAIRRNLGNVSILIVEVVQFSGFSAYPYNHAFSRSMELIGLLESPLPEAVPLSEQLPVLLQQEDFVNLTMDYTLPAFIPRDCNHVVSLALEACRDAILHCRGSTAEELNALLLELREFEQQPDTLISRPGLLQVSVRPSHSTPDTIR